MSIKIRAKSVLNFITDRGNSITIEYGKASTIRGLVVDCLSMFLQSEGVAEVTSVIAEAMASKGVYSTTDPRWDDRSWLETVDSDVVADSIALSMFKSLSVIDNLAASKRLDVGSDVVRRKINDSVRAVVKQHFIEVIIHE